MLNKLFFFWLMVGFVISQTSLNVLGAEDIRSIEHEMFLKDVCNDRAQKFSQYPAIFIKEHAIEGISVSLNLACQMSLNTIKPLFDSISIKDIDRIFSNESILLSYIIKGESDIVNFLIDKGMNVNDKNEDGSTPLILATTYCDIEILDNLINKGADPYALDNRNQSAISYVLERKKATSIFRNKRCGEYDLKFLKLLFTNQPCKAK